MMNEYMCPNCVTPWKCNGPHIPEYAKYATEEEIECPCCKDWFSLCDDPNHTNSLLMCAFCALGQHNIEAPCSG
jgi:hypothetical protein